MKTILTILMVLMTASPALCFHDTLNESVKTDTMKKRKIRHFENHK